MYKLETCLFTKIESSIFKHNVRVFRNSPLPLIQNACHCLKYISTLVSSYWLFGITWIYFTTDQHLVFSQVVIVVFGQIYRMASGRYRLWLASYRFCFLVTHVSNHSEINLENVPRDSKDKRTFTYSNEKLNSVRRYFAPLPMFVLYVILFWFFYHTA